MKLKVGQLALFVILLIYIALPVALRTSKAPDPAMRYQSVPSNAGDYDFIARQIFNETSTIDILFVGSSQVWQGIDAEYFSLSLQNRFKRKLNILVLGSNWQGIDMIYCILRDMLSRRRVKRVVLQVPSLGQSGPHYSLRWVGVDPIYDPVFLKMNISNRLKILASEMLGAPWHFESLILGRKSQKSNWTMNSHGNLIVKSTMDKRQLIEGAGDKFPLEKVNSDLRLRPEVSDMSNYERAFLESIHGLVKKHGVKLGFVYLPRFDQIKSCELSISTSLLGLFPEESFRYLGIRHCKLFNGFADDEIKSLFSDTMHLNKEGARYFSRAIENQLYEFTFGDL